MCTSRVSISSDRRRTRWLYYLKRKINSQKIDLGVIIDIDLYRIEPWDIQDMCKLGYEEQNEWYFFSHKDRKYPTGTRTNRATTAGFWKATGRDKAVLSKDKLIGMRKTLVFYKGRAPNGTKSDWIMHEYRLHTSENGPPQEEGWVVCRAFKKPCPSHKQGFEAWNNSYFYGSHYRNPSFPSTTNTIIHNFDDDLLINQGSTNLNQPQMSFPISEKQMIELPKLDRPSISNNIFEHDEDIHEDEKRNFGYNELYNEWKSFDYKLLASHQVIGPSSYAYTNTPLLLPHNDELHAQAHLSADVLECFPDL
ncbi:hypothetical protein DH2020_007796 [Rehmannia glutinosa]|uniref:NAC domain-containing protein n=1 Tax=Rehmannia glutinosa TaxID=99300 RepID=A0ABR0TZU8_REHGL